MPISQSGQKRHASVMGVSQNLEAWHYHARPVALPNASGLRVLALVPARGGSKGIPRKNLQLLGGRPLVAHAVATGLAASRVSRVVCSTDDPEIAEAARSAGAEVPFLRPSELARDNSEDWPVYMHALNWLEQHEGWLPDLIVNLRPTSPL